MHSLGRSDIPQVWSPSSSISSKLMQQETRHSCVELFFFNYHDDSRVLRRKRKFRKLFSWILSISVDQLTCLQILNGYLSRTKDTQLVKKIITIFALYTPFKATSCMQRNLVLIIVLCPTAGLVTSRQQQYFITILNPSHRHCWLL